MWYSMLNVSRQMWRCEVVLKFRAATSTLPKHEDTRGSNISKTEHSTVSPLSLFYVIVLNSGLLLSVSHCRTCPSPDARRSRYLRTRLLGGWLAMAVLVDRSA